MTNNQLTLSDFIVQKVIGEGSYGRAVLCKQISDDKLVVIKEISLKKLTEQEQRDAWKETKVLSLLHHPNIIAYYGCFLQNNVLHIVMEYADNGDLSEEIRKSLNNNQHFDEDKILNWFVQICLALKHLHDRKILHRDLKNQNIFLLKDNTAKLGDFGIAKMLSSTSQMSNTAIGTPYYLSPEICQGKAYNMKSDVWSLGCILYELCTLHHPFDSNCLNGLIIQIQRAKPPPIPYYYSSNLRNLVDKLLQKSPAKRPSVNQILELDFIRCRVPNFLSHVIEKKEFCHTILHDFKPGESPEKAKVTPEDVENNNANLALDQNNNRGSRNRLNSRGRNSRQGSYRSIPKYSSNRNIYPDNRRKINKNEDNEARSPRIQYRINSSPQISKNQSPKAQLQIQSKKAELNNNNQFEIISDYVQKNEDDFSEKLESNNYETDESSELSEVYNNNDNDEVNPAKDANYNITNNSKNDRYHSNQNVNFENKVNQSNKNVQRKSVQRRTKAKNIKNDNNYLYNNNKEPTYISAAEHLQAKKNAAVLIDRAMVRELREKKAIEEKMIQQKNEEKRREVQEKAKAREIQRKEQMRRLKQEEKERQEKYKKLKPTFRIDRNIHYHTNPDSESNDSYMNSNSDIDYDGKRAERIKKRKEDEAKKENLKRNASAIAEKIRQSNNDENDQNSKKKRENDIQALREFLHQRRSEIRKSKQEDVIMIGNEKFYVGDDNDNISNTSSSPSNDEDLIRKQNSAKTSKKDIENEVYGLIFDNYANNDQLMNEDENDSIESPIEPSQNIYEGNKDEIYNYYNEDLLLTSDNNSYTSPEKEKSPQAKIENDLKEDDNQNNDFNSGNKEESSYLITSSESIDQISPSNNNTTNSINLCSRRISFESNSPSSIKDANEMSCENPQFTSPQINEYSSPDNENHNSNFNIQANDTSINETNDEIIQKSPIKDADSGYEYSPIKFHSNPQSTPRSSLKSSSDYDYSPMNPNNKEKARTKSVKFADSGYEYSPPLSKRDGKNQPSSFKVSGSDSDYSPFKNNKSIDTVQKNLSRSPNDQNSNSPMNDNNKDRIKSNSNKSTDSGYNYSSPVNLNASNNINMQINPNSVTDYSPINKKISSNTQNRNIINKTTDSEYDYSPINKSINSNPKFQISQNKSSGNGYDYSPTNKDNENIQFNSTKTSDNGYDYSAPINKENQRIPTNSSRSSEKEYDSPTNISKSAEIKSPNNRNEYEYSPNNNINSSKMVQNEYNSPLMNNNVNSNNLNKAVDDFPNNRLFNDEAANHKNTIIQQIDKLLMDSLSISGLNEDEENKNLPAVNKNDIEENDQKTEICLSIHSEFSNDDDKIQANNEIVCSPEGNLNLLDLINHSSPLKKSLFSNNYNFTFRGNELQLNNIKSNDSLAYKIETVRKFIEDSLGIDKSIKAYRLAEENNFSNYKDILTTPDQQSFYPLLLQLVSSEEILLAKWLK